MRPVIGMTVSEYPGYGYRVRRPYGECLEKTGALGIMLPFTEDTAVLEEMISHLDGLLLTGGGDPHPRLFGEEVQPVKWNPEPDRDLFEIALIRRFWETGKPVMAVCRGLQILNVALDGSIYQDLAYAGFHGVAHDQTAPMEQTTHAMHIYARPLKALLGEETQVNSSHHQGLKVISPELLAAAEAPDGLTEAVTAVDNSRFVLAVQWHPERLQAQSCLFSAFVAACRR